jgi:predicted nucleic acid-binding protein
MRYGLELLDDGKRKAALVAAFGRIETDFTGRILGFSVDVAHRCVTSAVTRRRAVHPLETKDAMIAAICLAHAATLATSNKRLRGA